MSYAHKFFDTKVIEFYSPLLDLWAGLSALLLSHIVEVRECHY